MLTLRAEPKRVSRGLKIFVHALSLVLILFENQELKTCQNRIFVIGIGVKKVVSKLVSRLYSRFQDIERQ